MTMIKPYLLELSSMKNLTNLIYEVLYSLGKSSLGKKTNGVFSITEKINIFYIKNLT